MSKELLTVCKDITIYSTASNGKHYLTVFKKRGKELAEIAQGSYPMAEYGKLIKTLWEDYLRSGEKPKLLGQTLSDDGFVIETLHYIAPGVFTCPGGPMLDDSRESFLYWLKAEAKSIGLQIDEKEVSYLNGELEDILRIHLERKGCLEKKGR